MDYSRWRYNKRNVTEKVQKDREKRIKEKILTISKVHRDKAAIANEGVYRKRILVTDPPSSSSKCLTIPGSSLSSRQARLTRTTIVSSETEDKSNASLVRKRMNSDTSSSFRSTKLKPHEGDKDSNRMSLPVLRTTEKDSQGGLDHQKGSGVLGFGSFPLPQTGTSSS